MKTKIQITNQQTGEVLPIVRSVTHRHPAWVHQQCDIKSERELQIFLDSLAVEGWYRGEIHLGPDCNGLELFR